MVETWGPVVGYEGAYEINRLGTVRSVDRVSGVDGRRLHGKVISQRVGRKGYPECWVSKNGRTKHLKIHIALLEAFVGPRPSASHQARHLNDDRLDFRLENLAWGTRSENNLDRVRNGIHHYSKRKECSRGHKLVEWNLYPANDKRRCKACESARRRIRHRISTGSLQEVSDELYRKLWMEFANE